MHRADRWELKFYSCFERVDDWATALGRSASARASNDTCGVKARQALAQERPGHVGHGVAFYVDLVADALADTARTSVYLVRQESLQADVDGIAAWLGVRGLDTALPRVHTRYPRSSDVALSPPGRAALVAALAGEFAAVRALEAHAVNGVPYT